MSGRIRSLPLPVLKRQLITRSIIPARLSHRRLNFAQAALKKSTFAFVGRQRKGSFVTFRRFRLRSDSAQQIGPPRMQQVILVEIALDVPAEALKAQAVAARPYALRLKLASDEQPYHLGSSVLHQVYRGLE